MFLFVSPIIRWPGRSAVPVRSDGNAANSRLCLAALDKSIRQDRGERTTMDSLGRILRSLTIETKAKWGREEES